VLVGVLALQGAFDAHVRRLTDLGLESRLVKDISDLDDLDGIILPGGESTTMSNLLVASGLGTELSHRLHEGLPVFGTCAGMIMMARTIQDGRPDQISLNAMDIQGARTIHLNKTSQLPLLILPFMHFSSVRRLLNQSAMVSKS
jgi:5'-phosphate synthase pdxT subunit